jgi:hypothetical protein
VDLSGLEDEEEKQKGGEVWVLRGREGDKDGKCSKCVARLDFAD